MPSSISDPQPAPAWHLYVVRTRDGALYAGIATDVERRFAEHAAGGARAARFLRGKGPLELVYRAGVGDRGTALRAESAFKRLRRADKLRLLSATAQELLRTLGLEPAGR